MKVFLHFLRYFKFELIYPTQALRLISENKTNESQDLFGLMNIN